MNWTRFCWTITKRFLNMFAKKPLPILMTMLLKASSPVGIEHVRAMTSLHSSFSWRQCIIVWSVYISLWQCDSFIPWSKMSDVKPFTIICGGANVSTGFPLFQHPNVVSSILPFLHPFSIFWYCACVLVCACALGRDLFSPTCLTCLTRLQIYVHVWLLYNNSNVLPLCSDDPSRQLPMTSCLICIIMVAE